ncbi:PLP-dependent cysteine synthase family protein [Streptomyces sp. XD-27]|uniref:PLP-dependent cysteine synthase family protein n=1 Tax=Streptomyces sp. XD-27 TaxID=3062779 RepID=UPI0026F445D0|nr:pyridoxal-phosphate dependent enzyme [Streptomyces sp. XD-27]WKX69451.1 pyridoxal-phosphate dependent enzyme [Streptomyces sp. XD-27]
MDAYASLTDAVGDTPLVRLNRITAGLTAPVYAKLEYVNPGGSVKDRAALAMVRAAEEAGELRPGGTIVEGTSGNTGVGLAMVAAQRGYRCVFVLPDKTSDEKVAVLRAYGARVVLCRSGLPLEHPDHVFNTAVRIAAETPGGWHANQYDNNANPVAHYRTTGPEIWRQTGGRITHLVAGVGTGGTITGAGEYLKEAGGGRVTVVGADPEASRYSGGDGRPYFVESIGHYLHPETVEDRWPDVYRRSVVDRFERIGDRESLLTARRLAREEGLLAGGSAGTAVAAALRVAAELGPEHLVVVVLPDSGRNYLSKVHDDGWLRHWGFLDGDGTGPVVGDAPSTPLGLSLRPSATVGQTLATLEERAGEKRPDGRGADTAALVTMVPERPDRPVMGTEILGSVTARLLRESLATGAAHPDDALRDHLAPAPPAFGSGEPAADALAALDGHAAETAVVLFDGRARALVGRAALAALVRAQDAAADGPGTAPETAPDAASDDTTDAVTDAVTDAAAAPVGA